VLEVPPEESGTQNARTQFEFGHIYDATLFENGVNIVVAIMRIHVDKQTNEV